MAAMSSRTRLATGLGVALLAALLSGLLATNAGAVPPERSTEPPLEFDNNSVFCGFPMRAEVLRDNVKITTFGDGRQLVTGSQTTRLTNLSSRKSLTLTDAGNVVTNAAGTAEALTGRLILFLYPGEPFGPGAFLFTGRVHATFAQPNGFFYSHLEYAGGRIDLCAALRD
jgi:hypothetical protein